ncbi:MAG: hypothetical protein CR980_00435 [Propionibacteriales bacterium]|nr:MAG: hypothetical protein CR980_00435 [Propionibacteriales bacterium]
MAEKRKLSVPLLVGIIGGVFVALIAAAYLIVYAIAGDRAPQGTQVAGVDIGGLTSAEAEERLSNELGQRLKTPVSLTSKVGDAEIVPAESGLGIDYAKSALEAGATKSFNPIHLWQKLVSQGTEHDPVTVVDEAGVTTAVEQVADKFETPPVSASVKWNGKKTKVTEAKNGTELDVQATRDAVVEHFYTGNPTEAVLAETPPEVQDEQVAEVVESFIKPASSGPITLMVDKAKLAISPEMIASATSFDLDQGKLEPKIDPEKLFAAAKSQLKALQLPEGRDAKIVLRNGKPTIIESVSGVRIEPKKLRGAVREALTKPDRTTKVKATAAKPKFTTEDAKKLGVKEVIGEYTTYYPHAYYRNVNIGLAAKGINGSLVKPGEIWSMNRTLGERTRAKGYTDGWMIIGGVLRKSPGGGISQSATTTFNAIFFAGLQDIEHHPHGLFFPRYPAGREATVAWGSLDLKFKNNTKYGVLLQAYTHRSSPGNRGSITVRVWSTKTYDVKSSSLNRSNYRQGKVRYDTSPKCHAQAPSPGFDVNYTRYFYKNGSLVRKEPFFWRYSPTDKVVCGPKPTPTPGPKPGG